MAKISELPVEAVVHGDEIIPALSGNTNTQITIKQINDYINSQLKASIDVSSGTNTFSRQYPVLGNIERGQGVYLVSDPNDSNTLKMKAIDNSASQLVVDTDTKALSGRLDGVVFDLWKDAYDFGVNLTPYTLTSRPATNDERNAWRINRGLSVPMTQDANEPTHYSWVRGANDPKFLLLNNFRDDVDFSIEIERVDIRDGNCYVTTSAGSYTNIPRRYIYNASFSLLTSDTGTTTSDYTQKADGSREWFCGRFDNADITSMVADSRNRLQILFYGDSSSTSSTYAYGYDTDHYHVRLDPALRYLPKDGIGEDEKPWRYKITLTGNPDDGNELIRDLSAGLGQPTEATNAVMYRTIDGRRDGTKYNSSWALREDVTWYASMIVKYSKSTKVLTYENSTVSSTRVLITIGTGTDAVVLGSFTNSQTITLSDAQDALLQTANEVYISLEVVSSSTPSLFQMDEWYRYYIPVYEVSGSDFYPIRNGSTCENYSQTTSDHDVDRLANLPLSNKEILVWYQARESGITVPTHETTGVGTAKTWGFGEQKHIIQETSYRGDIQGQYLMSYVYNESTNKWEFKKKMGVVAADIIKATGVYKLFGRVGSVALSSSISLIHEFDDRYLLGISMHPDTDTLAFRNSYSGSPISNLDTTLDRDLLTNLLVIVEYYKNTGELKYVLTDDGTKVTNYFAFPTIKALASNQQFSCGLGLNYDDGSKDLRIMNLFATSSGSYFPYINISDFRLSSYNDFFNQAGKSEVNSVNLQRGASGSYNSFYAGGWKGIFNRSRREARLTCYSTQGGLVSVLLPLNPDLTDFERQYSSTTRLFDGSYAGTYESISVRYDTYTHISDPMVFDRDQLDRSMNRNFKHARDLVSATDGTLKAELLYYQGYYFGSIFSQRIETLRTSTDLVTFQANETDVIHNDITIVCPNNVVTVSADAKATGSLADIYDLKVGQYRMLNIEIDPTSDGRGFRFSGSAADAVGIALNNYVDGDTGDLAFLAGSSLITVSNASLVAGADYYIGDGDGKLNRLSGRFIGKAITATDILLT